MLPGQGRPPSTILRSRKLEASGIPLRSLILTQYRSVTDRRTDRQTDGRICRSICSACKASFAGRSKNRGHWL